MSLIMRDPLLEKVGREGAQAPNNLPRLSRRARTAARATESCQRPAVAATVSVCPPPLTHTCLPNFQGLLLPHSAQLPPNLADAHARVLGLDLGAHRIAVVDVCGTASWRGHGCCLDASLAPSAFSPNPPKKIRA